jgi:TolA-binding protein
MKRLLEEGGSDFERSLLGSLTNEKPSPELVARMQQGLGIATTGAGAAAAGSAIWAKLGVVGLVAAGLVGVGSYDRVTQVEPVAAPPPVKPVPVEVQAAEAPAPTPVAVEDLAVQSQSEATPVRTRPAASTTVDLREEIQLLDRARAAVRAGEPNEALSLLAKYDRRYPRGQFRQEAQVIRVEALEQSGRKKAAVELGKKFVAAHPESPHVERVERVTGSDR